MALESGDIAGLDEFNASQGFEVVGDKSNLLANSYSFLKTLSFCPEPEQTIFAEAQYFLVRSLDDGADLFGTVENKVLVEKGLGKGSIVKKWKENEALSGTESISKLKTFPMSYNLLKPYLCNDSPLPAAFVV